MWLGWKYWFEKSSKLDLCNERFCILKFIARIPMCKICLKTYVDVFVYRWLDVSVVQISILIAILVIEKHISILILTRISVHGPPHRHDKWFYCLSCSQKQCWCKYALLELEGRVAASVSIFFTSNSTLWILGESKLIIWFFVPRIQAKVFGVIL